MLWVLAVLASGACVEARPAPAASAARLRSVQELQAALLSPPGLPAGLVVVSTQTSLTTASSTDPRCAALVTAFNTPTAVGSLQHVEERLSGGSHGPFVDESLDQMAGPDGVATEQTQLKGALAQCDTLTIADPGEAASTMTVTASPAPQVGSEPVAFTVNVVSGPQAGFTFTIVTAGITDTVLILGFVSTPPDQITTITRAAADQAARVLDPTATSTS